MVDGKESQILEGHTDYIASVAYRKDGNFLASGSWDKTIRIWDLSNAKESYGLKGHTDWITGVAYNPDG